MSLTLTGVRSLFEHFHTNEYNGNLRIILQRAELLQYKQYRLMPLRDE